MPGCHLFSVPSRLDFTYAELRHRALKALADGDRRTAGQLFDWAYLRSLQDDDAAVIDRAFCNRAALAIEFSAVDPLIPELERIARESPDPEAGCRAAYNLSMIFAFKDQRASAKALAHRACRSAKNLGNLELLGKSIYRLGLEYLKECRFTPARRCLEHAVEHLSELPKRQEDAALAASSLGYCLSLEGHPKDCRAALNESVRLAKGSSSKTYTVGLRLNFGFTFLNLEEHAATAEVATEVLSEDCQPDDRKHALYLAGAAGASMGRLDEAEYYLRLLQAEFYPDQPTIVGFLLTHPTHQLVNWLA